MSVQGTIGTDSIGDPPPAELLVLIIDDNPDDHESCIRTLSKISDRYYRFQVAFDGLSGLRCIADHAPDIVLLDYFLPDSNGLEVLRKIRELYTFLPVIMLTGEGNEALAARGIKTGANHYFNKSDLSSAVGSLSADSCEALTLHEAITLALTESQARKTSRQSVAKIEALIIDDNPDDREACRRALGRVPDATYLFHEASDGQAGLAVLEARQPDIVLLDYSLPGGDGLKILGRLREAYPFLPVIMLTGQGNESVAVQGIKAGASDYIPKSALSGEIVHRAIIAAIEHHSDARTIDLQRRTIERQREHLEHANHFLHSLLDNIPDPIYVRDAGHQLLMANLAFEQLVDEHAAFEDRAAVLEERRIADHHGVQRLFSIKQATFKDGQGGPVLVGVMRDITAQRRAEDDFKAQTVQLMHQSQNLASLGAILEESLQEVYIIEADSLLIVKANKGARRNLGYTPTELEQRSVVSLSPHLTETDLRKLLEPIASGEAIETVYQTAYRRKNGSLYDVEVHAQGAISNGRKLFVQMALDVTERNRVENMKSEFISKVSHELRTPLTSIRGALGLLNSGALGQLPEKACSLLGIALSNSERLARLVNDIIGMEKAGSGNLSLDIRETPVAEILRQAVESNTSYAEKYKVQFQLDQVSSDLLVMADALRLAQVLANLMSNAAKFSSPGLPVVIRAFPQQDSVRFEVEDKGCGIQDSFRPRMFERFAQADSSTSRRYDGSGLGLSITKQLVEAMGGQIGFVSEAERGSTFFFQLPQPVKVVSQT